MTNKLNYSEFFNFPQLPPTSNDKCVAVCKICAREYKYSLSTKGNLNHHLSNSHPGEYKTSFDQKVSVSNDSNQQLLPTLFTINDGSILDFTSFHRQDSQEVKVNIKVLVTFKCLNLEIFPWSVLLFCRSNLNLNMYNTVLRSRNELQIGHLKYYEINGFENEMRQSDWTLSRGKCQAVGVPHLECGECF